MTPTARTINLLEGRDWLVEIVEKRIPHTRPPITQDLFGVGDILAVRGHETVLIQVTDLAHNAAHVKKLKAEPKMHKWLVSGLRRLEVWAWRELKSSGRWEPRITVIALADLDVDLTQPESPVE